MISVGRLASRLAVSLAGGAALGWVWAAEAIAAERYLPLGLTRNAAIVLRAQVLSGIAAGAAVFVLLSLAHLATSRLRRRLDAGDGGLVPALLRSPIPRLRFYLAVAVGGTAVVVIAVRPARVVPSILVVAVLAAVALLAAGAALLRRWTGATGGAALRRRAALLAWTAAAGVGLLLLWAAATPSTRDPFRLDGVFGKSAFLLVAAVLVAPFARAALPWRVVRRSALALAVVLPAAALAAGWAGARPKASAPAQNVLLIGIDTLRHDRATLLRPDPEGRWLTPHLRALAARGTVFDRAYSASCWTMPSFASILTGLYPQEHGASGLFGALPERNVTLAEVLREAGYATGGIVSHLYVNADHGFAQGFDEFDDTNDLGPYAVTSPAVTDRAIRFLDRHAAGRFFLFVHYFDPHYQYMPHDDFPYGASYRGWLSRGVMNFDELEHWRAHLEPQDLRYLEDLYDGEVAFTDREIGRLVDRLSALGLDGNTAIVVVADHGEEFMEHGTLGHSTSLHEELVHVPLFMVLPGVAGGRAVVDDVVETRSVFPTLLDYLGVRPRGVPADAVSGGGLLPLIRGNATGPGEALSAVATVDAPESSGKHVTIVSLRRGNWNLIVDLVLGRRYLYDLAADPGEARDVAPSEPGRANAMGSALESWWRTTGGPAAGAHASQDGDELRERLKSLGYL